MRIAEEYPDEQHAMIDAARDVSFGVIVRVMDAVRGTDYVSMFEEIGFPLLERPPPSSRARTFP